MHCESDDTSCRLSMMLWFVGCQIESNISSDDGKNYQESEKNSDSSEQDCVILQYSVGLLNEQMDCVNDFIVHHDPYDIEMMWEVWLENEMLRSEVVADMNGDRISDILLISEYHDLSIYSYVLSGLDGNIIWTTNRIREFSPSVAIDENHDGVFELVAVDVDGFIVSFGASGEELWKSQDAIGTSRDGRRGRWPMAVADIGADGIPDIILPEGAVEAGTGRTLFLQEVDRDEYLWDAYGIAIGDIDLDGSIEILMNCSVFSETGMLLWKNENIDCDLSNIPFLVQLDTDDEAEVVFLTGTKTWIYEHDGTELFSFEMPDTLGNLLSRQHPCVGDLDGDGQVEIVRFTFNPNSGPDVYAWRLDGTLLWSRETYDGTWGLSCSLFDFDADGKYEVILTDEEDFSIVDGSSGDLLYQDDRRCGYTMDDSALIADIDGDGSAELIDVNQFQGACADDFTVRVYRHREAGWPPGSPVWSHAQEGGATMFPDGDLPRRPEPSWLTTGLVRGQPAFPAAGRDLRPVVLDACTTSCTDNAEVRLAVALQNLGPQEQYNPVPVALYTLDINGAPSFLYTLTFDPLPAQQQSASQEIVLTWAEAQYGLQLIAGDDGSGALPADDCNPADNTLTWLPACP